MCDKTAAMGATMLMKSQLEESESDSPSLSVQKNFLPVYHQSWVLSNVAAPIPVVQTMCDVWGHMRVLSLEKLLAFGSKGPNRSLLLEQVTLAAAATRLYGCM